jgi:hypothetical protein
VKLAVASLFVLALLGAHAQAYFNLADQLFAIRTVVSDHIADEDVGDEFRRSKN